MNKLLCTLILIVVSCVVCNAQKFNYGVEIGYLNNRLAVSEYTSTSKSGFLIGGIINLSLRNNISFESGISFVRKAGEISGDKLLGTRLALIKFSQMDYLRIPLSVGYKFKMKEFSVCPGFGPYYAIGISGDSFISGNDDFGQPFESRVSTFSNGYGRPYRPCNRNDFGLSFSLNAVYRHIGVKVGYDLGLTNTSYYGNGKQRSFIVSLAYLIK